jgi:FtsZ-binding cell division protein ZapB
MLKKSPELRLNSYKIDTSTLQRSLKELTDMKEELESTISQYKSHEDQLVLENERLREEIAMYLHC